MKPDEPTPATPGTTFNPAPDELLALVAQQPLFQGMSGHLIELLADSILEMRFKPAVPGFINKASRPTDFI